MVAMPMNEVQHFLVPATGFLQTPQRHVRLVLIAILVDAPVRKRTLDGSIQTYERIGSFVHTDPQHARHLHTRKAADSVQRKFERFVHFDRPLQFLAQLVNLTVEHVACEIQRNVQILGHDPVVFGSRGVQFPCLLYTSPSPRDLSTSRMPSSA